MKCSRRIGSGEGKGRANRRGSVLILALIVLTAVMMLAAGLSQLSTRAQRETRSSVDEVRALYLAEAGLGEAMTALRAGFPGGVGTPDAPATLAGGVFWVVATPQADETILLECTALAGSGRAALSMVVGDEEEDPLFAAVLNSDETLTMNSGVMVDSFDSELGSYESQVSQVGYAGHAYAKDGGHVASNQDIVLNANAVIFGDATPGPGHTVDAVASGSHISGSTDPSPEPFSFPPIAVPDVLSAGPLTVAAAAPLSLPPGLYGFDDLALDKDAKLKVTGPATLVVNHFTGGKDSQLEIDSTAGPVTIFVQGDYNHLSGFATVPAPGSPMALAFMVQGENDVMFPSQTKVRGAYYVPNAAVTFAANCEAFGSFAARRIDMSSSMRFHYDESLSKHWGGDGSEIVDLLRLLSWERAGVAPDLIADRRDPFQLLGLDQANLPAPADAWHDWPL